VGFFSVIPAIDLDLHQTFSGKISQSDPSDQGQPRGASEIHGAVATDCGTVALITSRIQQLMPSTASAMNADVA
jgi:hypothetical protein